MNVHHTRFDERHPSGIYGGREVVCGPKPHDGIGNALRTAYIKSANHIPQDLADLLARLD